MTILTTVMKYALTGTSGLLSMYYLLSVFSVCLVYGALVAAVLGMVLALARVREIIFGLFACSVCFHTKTTNFFLIKKMASQKSLLVTVLHFIKIC